MKKILIVLTNTGFYPNTKKQKGLWLGELTEFYEEIVQRNIAVDFVSPHGGEVPVDPFSLKFAKKNDMQLFNDKDFNCKALKNTLKPSQINPEDYFAIYYTGGHGVLWDFRDNKEIQDIALKIYQNGGYITAVCHGVVGLLNLKKADGSYLIEDKRFTGFTNTKEIFSGKLNKVPYLTENELKKRGAQVIKTRLFKPHVVQDGRIITGQNPWSPRLVAQALLKAYVEN